jgi:hypothetical protein
MEDLAAPCAHHLSSFLGAVVTVDSFDPRGRMDGHLWATLISQRERERDHFFGLRGLRSAPKRNKRTPLE